MAGTPARMMNLADLPPQDAAGAIGREEVMLGEMPLGPGARVAAMRASAINKELDRIDKMMSSLNERIIKAGRGSERFSDLRRAGDPLSEEYVRLADRKQELFREIDARMGPEKLSFRTQNRLPTHERGFFGPREP